MFFRKVLLSILSTLSLMAPAFSQQETPNSNPAEVTVKGRLVSHSWRNGRIWVPTSELQPLLNLKTDAREVDLIKALEEKDDYLWQVVDGRFEARRDPSKYSTASVTPQQRQAVKSPQPANGTKKVESAGVLYYAVREFTAETGYVRAYVYVVNNGNAPSDPSTMVCDFTDYFGKPYAEKEVTIPSMDPGESEVYEVFSMVKEEDTSIKPTKNNLTCYFLSLTNPASNPKSRMQWIKQSRERKL